MRKWLYADWEIRTTQLISVPLAQNESSIRNRRDGLGVDWALGFAASGKCYGYGAYQGGTGGVGSETGCPDIESRERCKVDDADGGGYSRLR